jgi:hypothetical protein
MLFNISVRDGATTAFNGNKVTYRTLLNNFYRFKNVTKIPLELETKLIPQQTSKSYIIRIKIVSEKAVN